MKLTRLERMSLSNQFRILEKLNPEDADHYSKQIEILESGYEFLYAEMFQNIYSDDEIMTEAECIEVWDTMDMFDGIDTSIKALGLEHEDKSFSKFCGYDGNSEGKFSSFAAFTVRREKRFTYLPLVRTDYFNSHFPAREIYGRMLQVWQEIPFENRFSMSVETLDSILTSAIHPEKRETEE